MKHLLPGLRVTLVTPYARQMYSGMVPGWVAGHYTVGQCVIPLAPLARAAGVDFVEDALVGLDADRGEARLAGGTVRQWDPISLDTGPVMDRDALPGAREHGLFVRPIETFVERFDGWRAARALRDRGIAVHEPAVSAVGVDRVVLADGATLPCDTAVIATGASAPAWLAGSGLALDARGFVLTAATLQSVSHPAVCAAGDVATRADRPHPKSGVDAVRAGPPLAASLRAWAEGRAPAPYTPQRRTRYLLSLGERRAIASWGPLAAEGDWVWRWKDRIDRGFIARHGGRSSPR